MQLKVAKACMPLTVALSCRVRGSGWRTRTGSKLVEPQVQLPRLSTLLLLLKHTGALDKPYILQKRRKGLGTHCNPALPRTRCSRILRRARPSLESFRLVPVSKRRFVVSSQRRGTICGQNRRVWPGFGLDCAVPPLSSAKIQRKEARGKARRGRRQGSDATGGTAGSHTDAPLEFRAGPSVVIR